MYGNYLGPVRINRSNAHPVGFLFLFPCSFKYNFHFMGIPFPWESHCHEYLWPTHHTGLGLLAPAIEQNWCNQDAHAQKIEVKTVCQTAETAQLLRNLRYHRPRFRQLSSPAASHRTLARGLCRDFTLQNPWPRCPNWRSGTRPFVLTNWAPLFWRMYTSCVLLLLYRAMLCKARH